MKHRLIMILCCLIPLALFAVLWATGFSGNYLMLAAALLCPVLHLLMMSTSKKGGDDAQVSHFLAGPALAAAFLCFATSSSSR